MKLGYEQSLCIQPFDHRGSFQTKMFGWISVDYANPASFQALRKALNGAQRPVHYLAVPPILFERVVQELAESGCAQGARVILEKPFGRDLSSAQELNRILLAVFDEPAIVRIDHYLGKPAVHNMLFLRFANGLLKVLKAIPPLAAQDLVRGQFRGYRAEKGVSPESQVETFAALRLSIESWRWQGVPFYIRAGKYLPVPCAEIVVRLRQPPTMYHGFNLVRNALRWRISPEITFAFSLNVPVPGQEAMSHPVEVIASRHPGAEEMDAYERVLGDAMAGDATLFAREDYVEEAWRIVDPVLQAGTPVHAYEPNSWGPSEVEQQVSPPGDWQNPAVTT